MTPFLLRDVQMCASGLADFEGTFDERYLMVFYEGSNFCLESPHFKLSAPTVKKGVDSEITPVHYFDLKRWNHIGFLPLQGAEYWQKNHDFSLEKAAALVHFENNIVKIQDIVTTGEGIDFQGDVNITIHSLEDIDLIISADRLEGESAQAQRFLAHFKPSFFCEIPLEGRVFGGDEALFFHYHFKPTASMVEGRVHGQIQLTGSHPLIAFKDYVAAVDYDCVTMDFSCNVTAEGKQFLTLNGTSQVVADGREISILGEGPYPGEIVRLKAVQKGRALSVAECICGPWKGEADMNFYANGVSFKNMRCWTDQNTGFYFSGLYDTVDEIVKGEISELKWDFTSFFEKGPSMWKPKGEIAGSGSLIWKIREGICSVDGLEVEIPGEESIEKYKLGRFHWNMHKRNIHFEGFDFSLPPEKLPWVAEMAQALFPGKIPSTLVDGLEALKQTEPLEGHISLELYPENVWIYLNLKDGIYDFSDRQLDLKNFHLAYDPLELNIWTQCLYRDTYYWLHLISDNATMSRGKFILSEREWAEGDEGLIATWEREAEGWCVKRVEGNFCGMEAALSASKVEDCPQSVSLEGRVQFDSAKIAPFFSPVLSDVIETSALSGMCALEGEFIFDKHDFSDASFAGRVSGDECQIGGVSLSAFTSNLIYRPNLIKISDFSIEDWAGHLNIHELILTRSGEEWLIDMDLLAVEDLRLSRLKSPWTKRSPRDKPIFRSLFIRSFVLENMVGTFGDFRTLLGSGSVDFTNLPRKTFLSNLLFLPTEITARIGLDFTNLVPVRGTIEYVIEDGRINILEFKEMYSDGKRSRFYLADGFPAYIDFKGNLNMKVKMKQYSLLMKLAEFFTVTVKGTLLHPTYTLCNHIDADD